MRDEIWTWATRATLARAVISAALLLFAIAERSQALLVFALALSMALDMLDGYIARKQLSETILGAQLDALADRMTAALVLAGAVYDAPSATAAIAAAAVWMQYGIVEQFLNGQFLRFGLWSPDHFYDVSPVVWRLNWSAPAKAASGVPVALIALQQWWPALGVAAALILVRVACYPRIAEEARKWPEARPAKEEPPAPPAPLVMSGSEALKEAA
jgi:phosphatidylglycerophosphate synthase